MERPVGLIEWKVAEAEYFLDKMENSGFDNFEFQCNLSAFLSASRSVTFTLQAVMRHIAGFNEWYESARATLVNSVLARFFVDLRNRVTKIGDLGIIGGSVTGEADDIEFGHVFDQDLMASLPTEIRDMDIEDMARHYMRLLVGLVSDWERWYYNSTGPGAPPTIDMTPEELEEALGFPAGWTDDVGLSNEERIQILLRVRGDPPPISFEDLRSKYGI
jgi:hypothetical protein